MKNPWLEKRREEEQKMGYEYTTEWVYTTCTDPCYTTASSCVINFAIADNTWQVVSYSIA